MVNEREKEALTSLAALIHARMRKHACVCRERVVRGLALRRQIPDRKRGAALVEIF